MTLVYPTRDDLIAWCLERASANRKFNGRLSPRDLALIRTKWPSYFECIAEVLERDGPKPIGPPP